MDMQLHNSKEKIAVSDAVFASDFNEALVHQLVTAYMAAAAPAPRHRKTVQRLEAAAPNRGSRKVLAVHVPVLSAVHCGEQVV